MPSELLKCPVFLVCFSCFFYFLSSPVVILFWPKMVCVAVCRLELNAADWNLNCDLAVANCESAAELPIKPFSSSHSQILVCPSVSFRLSFFCLSCFFLFPKKSSDQPFLKLLYVFGDILVYINHIFLFFHQTWIFQFVVMLQFNGSGLSLADWCCNSMLLVNFMCFFLRLYIHIYYFFHMNCWL